MPPKAKFSKEEITAAAMTLAKTRGMEAVTARELGIVLGSSARPVFTTFTNMEEVRTEVILAAKKQYRQYVEEGLEKELAFRGVGMAYIRFAVEEPKLFQLLFMREGETENDLEHVLRNIDDNYEMILKSVEDTYQLKPEIAKKIYLHLWLYTHGIATLCATGVCRFTAEEIEQMLTEIFLGVLKEIAKEK